jgi:hypothetical protein
LAGGTCIFPFCTDTVFFCYENINWQPDFLSVNLFFSCKFSAHNKFHFCLQAENDDDDNEKDGDGKTNEKED